MENIDIFIFTTNCISIGENQPTLLSGMEKLSAYCSNMTMRESKQSDAFT